MKEFVSTLLLLLTLTLTLTLTITACSSGPTENSAPNSEWYQVGTVDPHRTSGPAASTEFPGDLPDGSYGPLPEGTPTPVASPSPNTKKTPVVGMILGPGLNRTIAHVGILKKLEESKIKVHILSGAGMGLVVAAMYAGGMSPSKIEWSLFNFFQNCGNLAPYSPQWAKKIDELLIRKIGHRRIDSFPKSLVIPLYDVEQKQLRFFVRGDVHQLIRAALQLYVGSNPQGGRWISAINRVIFDRKMMANYKIDLLIGVDVLGSEIVFGHDSGFLLGNFKKIAGLVNQQKMKVDLFWQLPSSSYPLDDNSDIAQFLIQSNDYLKENIQTIKTKLTGSTEGDKGPASVNAIDLDDHWP